MGKGGSDQVRDAGPGTMLDKVLSKFAAAASAQTAIP